MSSLQRTAGSRKPSAAPRSAKSPSAGLRATPAAQAGVQERRQSSIAPESRRALIAKAAYFRAAGRGFLPGGELEDWLAAEAEIDRMMESPSS